MTVDRSLLRHWETQQAARARARRRLPQQWRHDPAPRLREVGDMYVELFAQAERAQRGGPLRDGPLRDGPLRDDG